MSDRAPPSQVPAAQRLSALSRWENEGGALEDRALDDLAVLEVPPLTNTKLVHLRVRLIAAEPPGVAGGGHRGADRDGYGDGGLHPSP